MEQQRRVSLYVEHVTLKLYRSTRACHGWLQTPPHFLYYIRCEWEDVDQETHGRHRGKSREEDNENAPPEPWWSEFPISYVIERRWPDIETFHQVLRNELVIDPVAGITRVKTTLPDVPKEEDVDRWLVAVAASGDVDSLSRKGGWLPHAEAGDEKASLSDLHAVYVEKRLNVYFKEVNKILAELPPSLLRRSPPFRNFVRCNPKDLLAQKNIGGTYRSFFFGSPRPTVRDGPPRSAASSMLANSRDCTEAANSKGFTHCSSSKGFTEASNSKGFTEASTSRGFTEASTSKGFDGKSQSTPDLSDPSMVFLNSSQASHYGFFAKEVAAHLVGEFCGEDHATRLLAKARRTKSRRMCLPMMASAANPRPGYSPKKRFSVETTTMGQALEKLEKANSLVTRISKPDPMTSSMPLPRRQSRDSMTEMLLKRSGSSSVAPPSADHDLAGTGSMTMKFGKKMRKTNKGLGTEDGDAKGVQADKPETVSPDDKGSSLEQFVLSNKLGSSPEPTKEGHGNLSGLPNAEGLSPAQRMKEMVKNKLGMKLAAPQIGMGSLAMYALGAVKDEHTTRELCDGLRAIILGADGLGGTGAIRCSVNTMHADLAFGSQAEVMELYKQYKLLIKMDRERGVQEVTAAGNDLPSFITDDDTDDAPVPEDSADDPSLMNLPPIRWSSFKTWISHERTFNDDIRVRSLCGSLLRGLKQWKANMRGKMPASQFGVPLSRMLQWMWPGAKRRQHLSNARLDMAV